MHTSKTHCILLLPVHCRDVGRQRQPCLLDLPAWAGGLPACAQAVTPRHAFPAYSKPLKLATGMAGGVAPCSAEVARVLRVHVPSKAMHHLAGAACVHGHRLWQAPVPQAPQNWWATLICTWICNEALPEAWLQAALRPCLQTKTHGMADHSHLCPVLKAAQDARARRSTFLAMPVHHVIATGQPSSRAHHLMHVLTAA